MPIVRKNVKSTALRWAAVWVHGAREYDAADRCSSVSLNLAEAVSKGQVQIWEMLDKNPLAAFLKCTRTFGWLIESAHEHNIPDQQQKGEKAGESLFVE